MRFWTTLETEMEHSGRTKKVSLSSIHARIVKKTAEGFGHKSYTECGHKCFDLSAPRVIACNWAQVPHVQINHRAKSIVLTHNWSFQELWRAESWSFERGAKYPVKLQGMNWDYWKNLFMLWSCSNPAHAYKSKYLSCRLCPFFSI